jgi:hypothetical protein
VRIGQKGVEAGVFTRAGFGPDWEMRAHTPYIDRGADFVEYDAGKGRMSSVLGAELRLCFTSAAGLATHQ